MINRAKKVLDGTLAEVKATQEQHGLQIEYDGDGNVFAELRAKGMIDRLNDSGKSCELFPAAGVDPQDILPHPDRTSDDPALRPA